MEGVTQYPSQGSDQPEELQKLREKVKDAFEKAQRVQKPYKDRWDTYYGLYRNFRRLKSRMTTASERDRDVILQTERREWGAELFIPYCFTVVETIVPRVVSQDPKMIVPPNSPDAQDAAKRVQELFDVQQRQIDYDLKLQSVARSGLKYGLGVGKTYWAHEERKVLRNQPRSLLPGYKTVEQTVVTRDGPMFEPVSIWDFFWSPGAYDIASADYVIHRTWRTPSYVKRKVESGEWLPINLEAVEKRGKSTQYEQVWGPRLEAAGVADAQTTGPVGTMHEVWEYHDGEQVITVLNGELVVQVDTNPAFHREIPFQIYRPTPQEHEFVGIGEIEPIAHLQYELNTLRSQRRDNATLVLQKAFLYAEGFVDPDLLRIGPGKGIPVRGTNIKDVLQVIDFGDIPASSVSEEQAIKDDIERTTGVSDAVAGGTGGGGADGAETATGIQLIQAAANVRIRLKTKNLLAETVRHAGRQWLELDRQHMLVPKDIRVPDPQQPEGYRFETVGQKELNANIDYPVPDGGSTEPDNPPARQSAALALFNALAANESVDQQRLSSYLLHEYGVPDPDSFIAVQNTVPVDPRVLGETLIQHGFDPDIVLQAVDAALAAGTGQDPSTPEQLGTAPPPDPSAQQ